MVTEPLELAQLADRLLGFAAALTGSIADGEDLVADSLSAIYPRRAGIESAGAYAYFRQTILNRYRDGLRRRVRDRTKVRLITSGPDEQGSLDVDLGIDVTRALAALSADTRTVVVLRYLEDLSTATVAHLLRRPEGSIRRIASEGIATLRASGALDEYLPRKEGDRHA